MSDEPASLMLFTASKVMAMEPVKNPTAALNAAKKTLAPMPIMLVRTMVLFLLSPCGVDVVFNM
jgi:hypothetical protein